MDRRGFAIGLGLTGLLLPTAGCGAVDPTAIRFPPYRYRLTVEVNTPEGLKTGSSVIEVRSIITGKYSIPNPQSLDASVRGEAAAVDLGQRGLLFALLQSDGDVSWPAHATYTGVDLSHVNPKQNDFAHLYAAMIARRGVIVLPRRIPWRVGNPAPIHPDDPPRSGYPTLVRFADLRDPKSVQRVDPDDLAASFGTGIKLRRITVQLTDAPITAKLDERLRWLRAVRKTSLDPDWTNSAHPTLAQKLTYYDLKRGQ